MNGRKIRGRTTESEEWREITDFDSVVGRSSTRTISAIAVKDTVYVLAWTAQVWSIKPYEEPFSWTQLPMMNDGHGPAPAVAAIGGCLYVCGGGWRNANRELENGQRTKTFNAGCEKFDISTGEWSFIAEMSKEKRRNSVIAANGLLYCIGGKGHTELEPAEDSSVAVTENILQEEIELSDAEVYNPASNGWSRIESMYTARVAPALAKDGNGIYVLGGVNNENCLKSIELYDIRSGDWQEVKRAMAMSRRIFKAFVIDSYIYVIGGDDKGSDKTRTAERLRLPLENEIEDETEQILPWLDEISFDDGGEMATVVMNTHQ